MNVQIDVKSLEQGAYAAVMAGGTRALRELLATAEAASTSKATPVPVAKPRRGRKPAAEKAEKPAKPAKSASTKSGGKRERRSPEEFEQACNKVLSALSAGPLGMEKLVTVTGLDRKFLMLPVRKLATAGKIAQKGTKRATTYSLAA